MYERDYTPTKTSKILTNVTNTQTSGLKQDYDYNARISNNNDLTIIKQYETLKLQVKQLQLQNRQLSTEAEKLRYEKNIHENKYMQKVNYEEEALSQFQKQKNYQLELIRIKNDEDINKTRREFQYKLDEFQRQLKAKDYQTRQFNQKNAYLELKTNQLRKGVETLQNQLLKYRQNNSNLTDILTKQEFTKKKMEMLTEQLERQKCQMEAEIHVLLDIEAEKSRTINSLEVQLRNSESTERCLHQKLTILTDNFASLEEHIAIMKERLISADIRNQQIQKQLENSEYVLADKQNSVSELKDFEVRFRNQLQNYQNRQIRREKQLNELINENESLFQEFNANRQKLHDICINQGLDI